MADADVPITAGTGTKIDTRTVGPGTDEHRQVVVIGDPTTAANVLTVTNSGISVFPAWTEAGADGRSNGNLQSISSVNNFGNLNAAPYVFNGTSWDRLRGIGGLPASDANTGIQAVATVPHKTGYAIASATARYTTTQTSTVIGPTVGSTTRMVVTSLQIQAGGTTAGEVVVYFGTGAYARGTTWAIFDGEFAPSATHKPGYAQSPSVPFVGSLDGELRLTTSAALNPLTVTVWYYLTNAGA
jgi:hypothetical protein